LSEKTLSIFLLFINKIWILQEIPKDWKHSIIIPIHKNGKNPSDPLSLIAYYHIYLEIPFFAVNHVSITYQMLFESL
jgi:hypothetical protein